MLRWKRECIYVLHYNNDNYCDKCKMRKRLLWIWIMHELKSLRNVNKFFSSKISAFSTNFLENWKGLWAKFEFYNSIFSNVFGYILDDFESYKRLNLKSISRISGVYCNNPSLKNKVKTIIDKYCYYIHFQKLKRLWWTLRSRFREYYKLFLTVHSIMMYIILYTPLYLII